MIYTALIWQEWTVCGKGTQRTLSSHYIDTMEMASRNRKRYTADTLTSATSLHGQIEQASSSNSDTLSQLVSPDSWSNTSIETCLNQLLKTQKHKRVKSDSSSPGSRWKQNQKGKLKNDDLHIAPSLPRSLQWLWNWPSILPNWNTRHISV